MKQTDHVTISTKTFSPPPNLWKYFILVGLAALMAFPSLGLSEVIANTLADAFIAVSSFVALTLLIFDFLERKLKIDPARLLKKHERWQPLIAAVIGALPGCGGAIIVITQYVLGRMGFGGMVAVLTSTMGDAAFLLLARDPQAAVVVFSLSITAGTITGMIVDKIHGRDFLRQKLVKWEDFRVKCGEVAAYSKLTLWVWYILITIAIALGFGNAFQVDTDAWFGALSTYEPTKWIGAAGAMMCLFLWANTKRRMLSLVNLAAHPECKTRVKFYNCIILDTTFVTSWVIFAFLCFELLIHFTQFDLNSLFSYSAPLIPLMGVLIGFIPGCGPQVILTTLYLNGLIPFSAQLANAISNDGDALFPAIALAPKTAIVATIYTSIPALLLGYGWYFLMEV